MGKIDKMGFSEETQTLNKLMRKIIIIAIIIFTAVIAGRAQAKRGTDANIVGDVQSKGEHVPYVTVSINWKCPVASVEEPMVVPSIDTLT